jgi:hypothetical protein
MNKMGVHINGEEKGIHAQKADQLSNKDFASSELPA